MIGFTFTICFPDHHVSSSTPWCSIIIVRNASTLEQSISLYLSGVPGNPTEHYPRTALQYAPGNPTEHYPPATSRYASLDHHIVFYAFIDYLLYLLYLYRILQYDY